MTVEAFIFGLVSLVAVFVVGTWVLSRSITASRDSLSAELSKTRNELNARIAMLEKDIAVMKANEESRGEKLEQLWTWWLKSIEHGWIAHMKTVASGKD